MKRTVHAMRPERLPMMYGDLHQGAITAGPLQRRAAADCDSVLIADWRGPIPAPGGRRLHKDEVTAFKCNLVKEKNHLCKWNSTQ
ncbi:hypothetical protein EYF80_062312 [Liparis tanakae]|uniref:Uncharacterized protein n=1 Tax=Liparis tanakae TaxID=230148 RepID=A0A4Z2EGW4_9TELE|nr:hypothetical protein EYF80_062312 [Liparis tanakae]